MGVVCQPLEHHQALQCELLTDLNAMQSWNCKYQHDATSITLAVTPCPVLSLGNTEPTMNVCWLPNGCNLRQQVVFTTNAINHRHRKALKRVAGRPLVSRTRFKRQRVLVDCKNQLKASSKEPLDQPSVASLRSLQFALPDLTSQDTLRVLHAMHAMPSELRHLNSRASRHYLRRRCKVRQVFGWRHLLCQEEEDEQSARRVVWKSAKTMEAMRMRPLAHQIWQAGVEATAQVPKEGSTKVLYTVNRRARVVVRAPNKEFRNRRDQVWLECFLDDGRQICVARKELRQFNGYCAPETSATECQGFLVRPVYTRAINVRLAGCSLQCLRAIDAKDSGVLSAVALKQQLLHDLPQLTLQWEEDHIYDLVQAPQVLLDSVFAYDLNAG
ncbi:hypothetical protein CCR75_007343 [Bremia lactucae]|uniref:Uncharacterized protein n=1 Tax=Bremia lactucae TaxID=4779 RepID=A0A976FQQ7_BRELC|nr:hypothetical protein CCR75_007343 [Bremia lactucae]